MKMKTNGRVKPLILLFAFTILFSKTFSQANNATTAKYSKPVGQRLQYNFIHFFPDTALATLVAEKLNRQITDKVTVKELASIKGEFQAAGERILSLKGIGYLIGLESLSTYKNGVTTLPSEIGRLKNLVYLDLTKAFELKTIAPQIGKLKKLKYLGLALTEVDFIPSEIGNLTNLQTFSLCCNNLTSIPREIGNLKNLIDLDIHSNSVKTLPDEICNLTSLTSLDISYCDLTKLPQNIGNLKQLQTLNLFSNDIKFLPRSIIHLDNLSSLNVYDNYELSEGYKKYLPKLLKGKKTK